MTPSTQLQPPFAEAMARAVSYVHQCRRLMARWHPAAESVEAEYERLHLMSLATLVVERGNHLGVGQIDLPDLDSLIDMGALLSRVHAELVDHCSGTEDYKALQFVSEVAALRQGVSRLVRTH